MTGEDVLAYCLAKPGAWQDEPWEGDVVAKVGDKIFALLGAAEIINLDGVGGGELAGPLHFAFEALDALLAYLARTNKLHRRRTL